MLHALKRRFPERIIRRISRHPIAVVSALTLSMRVGKDAYRSKIGKITRPEFRARTGSHLGSLSGGLVAARVGAAVGGALVPGIGSILGAFAGGILGEELGGRGGRTMVQSIEKVITGEEPAPPSLDEEEIQDAEL